MKILKYKFAIIASVCASALVSAGFRAGQHSAENEVLLHCVGDHKFFLNASVLKVTLHCDVDHISP